MEIQNELKLFIRYHNKFNNENNSLLSICSVHLAQQLEPYISRSLDLGWVIKCILDINSDNLFSGARVEEEEELQDNSVHPEYKYAGFIVQLAKVLIAVSEGRTLPLSEAKNYELDDKAKFYFGQNLYELNKGIMELACPNFSRIS